VVVVNYRATAGVKGKLAAQALSATELEQIQNLVKENDGL
jgi:flagellar biosynthesis/type III secretory pathway M-ring protein FliF/YscJ